MAVPLNEMPNRLDQMRDEVAGPMMGGPTPPPVNLPPDLPLAAEEPADLPLAAEEPAEAGRMDELLAALGGEGEMMPPEPTREENPMVVGSALAQAAVENTGSVEQAKASLEAALAELEAVS